MGVSRLLKRELLLIFVVVAMLAMGLSGCVSSSPPTNNPPTLTLSATPSTIGTGRMTIMTAYAAWGSRQPAVGVTINFGSNGLGGTGDWEYYPTEAVTGTNGGATIGWMAGDVTGTKSFSAGATIGGVDLNANTQVEVTEIADVVGPSVSPAPTIALSATPSSISLGLQTVITAYVAHADGQPAAGVTLDFASSGAAGDFDNYPSPTTAVTGSNGGATITWIADDTVGTANIVAHGTIDNLLVSGSTQVTVYQAPQ
jgi:hypothetical protein